MNPSASLLPDNPGMDKREHFTRVEAVVEPYSRTQDAYQAYYRKSIAAYCSRDGIAYSETGSRFPGQLRLLRRARDSRPFREFMPQLGAVADSVARLLGADDTKQDSAAGCYLFHQDDRTVKICIDAHDSAFVTRPDLLQWCHVYFKTNYWPGYAYPAKVAPIANVNPLVFENCRLLRELRNARKELDLFAFFRVWGGADEIEGVEHNLKLLEALSRVRCRKRLMAYLVSGDIGAAAARLEKAGVPWTTKWMLRNELWRVAASSRLNVVRHGMHQCIPWRMTDVLAMGGCPVLDYAATTRWHVPLRENVHYLNMRIPYRPNECGGGDPDEVVGRIESWLASEELTHTIARNTAEYFDEVLTPESLGRHVAQAAASIARVNA